MHDYQFEFVTGCPGSGWSNITHRVRSHLTNYYDVSDLKDKRCHLIPDDFFRKHTDLDPDILTLNKKLTHFGSYFGPGNEYGQNFDRIAENYSRDEFVKECLAPFDPHSNLIKQIKSHWFAYNLDWIWENFKGHNLLLILKDPDQSYIHWWDVGGWEINHPNYDWYRNLGNMQQLIRTEAELLEQFVKQKNLQLVNFDPDWFAKCYQEFDVLWQGVIPALKNPKYQIKIARTVIK
jgi:hypothetical protein